jgi:hypothetical protein
MWEEYFFHSRQQCEQWNIVILLEENSLFALQNNVIRHYMELENI